MRQATDVPLAVAEACVQVLELAAVAAEMGNRNARVTLPPAHLAQAALLSVGRNVRLNVSGMDDHDFRRLEARQQLAYAGRRPGPAATAARIRCCSTPA